MAGHFTPDIVVRPHGAVRTLLLTTGDLGVVALDQRTNARHQLSGGAAAVWAYLDRPTSVADLFAGMQETFGLTLEAASGIVRAALEQFWAASMLVGSPEPAMARTPPRAEEPAVLRVLAREPDP